MCEALAWLQDRFDPAALLTAADIAPLLDLATDDIVSLCMGASLPFKVEASTSVPRVRCLDLMDYLQRSHARDGGLASGSGAVHQAPLARSTHDLFLDALFRSELRGAVQFHAVQGAFEQLLQELNLLQQPDGALDPVCLEWLDRRTVPLKLRSKAIAAQLRARLQMLSDIEPSSFFAEHEFLTG